MSKSVTVKSYAKLNLYLEITGRRDDGYHMLKSVMQSISLYDLLKFTLSEGEGIELICSTDGIPLDKSNLIWKAIEAFYSAAKVEPGKITVKLEKNIPSMAGMAGGSSNAAAALAAMNQLYGEPLTLKQLCEVGATLGADVSFCIKGGTVLCEGVGDVMTGISSLPECYFAVVKPAVSVSTPEAYKRFDSMDIAEKPDFDGFMAGVENADIKLTADKIYNSLEIACDLKEVESIKRQLIEAGSLNAMMTGSGSAVFGIFSDIDSAENAVKGFGNYSFSGVYKPVNKGIEIV